MSLGDEVDTFLKEYKQKARTYEMVFYPRRENDDCLLELGITAKQREQIIMNLKVENYYRGPTNDASPEKPAYYEFGVKIKKKEVYIKLSLGMFDNSPHCMSFHVARYSMNYPL